MHLEEQSVEFNVFTEPVGVFLGLVTTAYLLGSISSAIVVCALLGFPDPRTQGSSNPGATNVMRIAGKGPALLTLIGDVLKGILPVLAASALGFSAAAATWIGLAAFIGHLLPVFFRFQGGKGVATAFGVLFALYWPLGVISGLVWLSVFGISRISSLASMLAFVAAPLSCWWLLPEATLPMALLSATLLARHHSNIRNLVQGEELGFKKR
mgnify:CR=1 FL=1